MDSLKEVLFSKANRGDWAEVDFLLQKNLNELTEPEHSFLYFHALLNRFNQLKDQFYSNFELKKLGKTYIHLKNTYDFLFNFYKSIDPEYACGLGDLELYWDEIDGLIKNVDDDFRIITKEYLIFNEMKNPRFQLV